MHPPEWILKKLYEVNKDARLGGSGKDRKPGDPLNFGTFALIELRPARAVDTDRSIIGVRWNHGPIFGKHYDPLRRVPIFIIAVSCEDVFSGRVIDNLKRWSTPFKQRALAVQKERGDEYELEVTELAHEQADSMMFDAKQTSSAGVEATPRKHLTAAEKEVLSGDYLERPEMNLREAFTEAPLGSAPLP